MNFEKIRIINKSKIIIGGLISLGVISVGVLATSRAKYRTTESFNIVNGTINYRVPDLKVMAMYQENDTRTYDEITSMPSSGYVINESKSYCNLNGSKDTSVRLYTENTKHNFENLQKGDKCYLYFDKIKITNSTELIANSKINKYSPSFSNIATTDEGIYQIPDGMYSGTSYYYRGTVDNNYVNFAGFCWRIIRINGDGSVRLIYDGTTCHANGTNTTESIVKTNQAYNSTASASYYVGWTYVERKQRPSKIIIPLRFTLNKKNDKIYLERIKEVFFHGKTKEMDFRRKSQNS